MSDLVDIEITKVKDPGLFYARVIHDPTETSDALEFELLEKSLNDYYNTESLYLPSFTPDEEEICIGRRVSDRKWCRVQVKGVFSRSRGPEGRCFFLDYGLSDYIPLKWFRKASRDHLSVAFQVKKFCLYGVKPLTWNVVTEDITLEQVMTDKWDTSAVALMNQVVKESRSTKARVRCVDQDDVHHVDLYFFSPKRNIWLNEEFVTLDYAAKISLEDTLPDSGEAVIQKLLRHTKTIESLTDKVTRARPPHSSGCCSDTEGDRILLKVSKTGRSSIPVVEKMKHRSIHNTVADQITNSITKSGENDHRLASSSLPSPPQKVVEILSDTEQQTMSHTDTTLRRKPVTLSQYKVRKRLSDQNVYSDSEILTARNRTSPLATSASTLASVPVRSSVSPMMSGRLSISSLSSLSGDESPKTAMLGGLLRALSPENNGLRVTKDAPQQASELRLAAGAIVSSNHRKISKSDSGELLLSDLSATRPNPKLSLSSNEAAPGTSAIISPNHTETSPRACVSMSLRSSETVSGAHSRLVLSPVKTVSEAQSGISLSPMKTEPRANARLSLSPNKTEPRANARLSISPNKTVPGANASGSVPTLSPSPDQIISGVTKRQSLSPNKTVSGANARLSLSPNKTDSLLTMKKLVQGDVDLLLTRARLPKSAVLFSTSEGDSSGKSSESASSEEDRIMKNSISKKSDSGSRTVKLSPRKCSGSASSKEDKMSKKSTLKKSDFVSSIDRPSVRFRDSEAVAESLTRKTQMMGRLAGKKLLDKLAVGPDAKKSRLQKKPSDRANLNDDGVLVHSQESLRPVYNIQDTPLDLSIRQALDDSGLVAPKFIQCYSWPAILRGRNVVGVAPSGSGKTLAYLAPLLTDLLKTSNYKDIPTGNGPYAIVIVPFWRSAQMIYDKAKTLLSAIQSTRVLVTYGGGNEEIQVVPLINGCELLITTPRSLSRVLEQKYTHLERLCHIVIDDAEIVLEVFKSEIQDFMTSYARVVEENIDRSAPREVLVFGSRWCSSIDSFIRAFMPEHTLIITSRFEAAIYGRVKQIPLLWRTDELVSQFLELVSSLAQENHKMIIFCSTANTTIHVHKLLSTRSQYSYMIHDKMDTLQLEQIGGEWAGSADNGKILICTDDSVEELRITDATAIVHYDLPSSKTKFGNRLSTLSEYYYNSSTEEKVAEVEPTSYIIITQESGRQVETIVQLLKRTKSKVPRNLWSMVMGMNQQKESDADKELCVSLKAYGACRYQNKCPSRHALLPGVDYVPSDNSFNSGEVKVLVTSVVDASHYFVRVLEHRPPDSKAVDMSTTMLDLRFKMAEWFLDVHNRSKYSTLCPGEMCAVSEDEETYHRVKVCDITGINSPGDRIKAELFFVDDGRKSFVSPNKLYNLPPHLKEVSYQAMEVYICRVQPVDLDENWTSKASIFVHELLNQKTMNGRIVLRIGNVMWLDPLVERYYLNDVKAYCINMFVRSELLKNGFAVDNPNHLQLLYDLCKGHLIDVPVLNKQLDWSEMKTEVEILPESKENHDVHLSAIISPTLIYLQRKDTTKDLEKMNDEINERMKNCETTATTPASVKVGSVCVAKFGEDDIPSDLLPYNALLQQADDYGMVHSGDVSLPTLRWYRVRIVKELDEDIVEVFHVDFGDQESVSRDCLHTIPQEFLELPYQAIEAGLSHIVPRGETWEKAGEDLIWDLTHFVTGEMKVLKAKVVSKQQATHTGIHKYFVELYDTSTMFDINLAVELVWSGYATPMEDSTYHELFLPPQECQFFTIAILKILDLCGQIYWGKGDANAQSASREILRMVKSYAQSKPLNLVAYGGLKAIIKLIGRVGFEDIHSCLVESLIVAAGKHDRLCEEIIDKDGGVGLVNSLEQTNRPWLQEQALNAINKLLFTSSRFVVCFEDDRVILVLCELLDSTHQGKVQIATCRVLRTMCRLSETVMVMAHDHKVCTRLVHCLGEGDEEADSDVAKAALELLDTLVEKDENASSLTKDKLVKAVVGVLKYTESETCILCGLRFCANFGKMSRKYKTTLLQLELVATLNRILDLPGLCSASRDLCVDLKSSLVIIVQSTLTIKHMPISQSKVLGGQPDSIIPKVLWSENIFIVTLSIKVVDVDAQSEPVHITENSVSFRASVEGKAYAVEYMLYDSILPTRSHVKIGTGDVTVVLRKNQKGRWPRLTKLKLKPVNLLYDFDRYEDSSSADEDNFDEDCPVPVRKSKKSYLPTGPTQERKQEIMERHHLERDVPSEQSSDERGEVHDDRDPYDIFDSETRR